MLCPYCNLPLLIRPRLDHRVPVLCTRCKAILGIDTVTLKEPDVPEALRSEYRKTVVETYDKNGNRIPLETKANGNDSK